MDNGIYVDPSQVMARKTAVALTEGVIVAIGSADDDCTLSGAAPASGLLGVNLHNVSAGLSASIQFGGIARVKTGAAVTRGAFVAPDASGRAVAKAIVAGGATVFQCLGEALDAAGAADEYIAVRLCLTPQVTT